MAPSISPPAEAEQGSTSPSMASSPIATYERFLSSRCQKHGFSMVKQLVKFTQKPGMILLAAGQPDPDLLPLSNLSFDLTNGEKITYTQPELKRALMYTETAGNGALCELVADMTARVHKPLPSGYEVVIGSGSQDMLAKIISVLLGSGDAAVVENPSYYTGLDILRYSDAKMVSVPQDEDGVDVVSLEKVFRDWNPAVQGKRPSLFYTVTCGSNPAGITVSLERRKKVLELAQKYDFLILEDDPYWYLESTKIQADGRPFPSYFALDTENRVIRVDSLSKCIAPGIRIGFAILPESIAEHVNWITSKSNLQPSALSQLIVTSMLQSMQKDNWKGLDDRVKELREKYGHRRTLMLDALEKHFGPNGQLLRWQVPDGGMFVWMRIVPQLPQRLLIGGCLEENILLFPGDVFFASPHPTEQIVKGRLAQANGPFLRASFASCPLSHIHEGIERLSALLHRIVSEQ